MRNFINLIEESNPLDINPVRKLLTLAAHPSTPKDEAIAALRGVFRKLQAANVSLANADPNDELVQGLQAEVATLKQEIQKLRGARSASQMPNNSNEPTDYVQRAYSQF